MCGWYIIYYIITKRVLCTRKYRIYFSFVSSWRRMWGRLHARVLSAIVPPLNPSPCDNASNVPPSGGRGSNRCAGTGRLSSNSRAPSVARAARRRSGIRPQFRTHRARRTCERDSILLSKRRRNSNRSPLSRAFVVVVVVRGTKPVVF